MAFSYGQRVNVVGEMPTLTCIVLWEQGTCDECGVPMYRCLMEKWNLKGDFCSSVMRLSNDQPEASQ